MGYSQVMHGHRPGHGRVPRPRTSPGDAVQTCAMPQDNLAVTLMALQRYDEAEPILREAVEGCGHRTSDGRKSGGRGVACSAKGGGGGI